MENMQLEKKVETWADFAVELYHTELEILSKLDELKVMADLPVTVETVEECDVRFMQLKQSIREVKELRLSKTNPLDKLKARLMQPEKEAADIQKQFELKLLEVKKAIAKERERLEDIKMQKHLYAGHVREAYADLLAFCVRFVDELASNTYSGFLKSALPFEEFDNQVKKAALFGVPSPKEWFEKRQQPNTPDLDNHQKALIYTDNKLDLPNYTAIFVEKMNVYKAGYKAELNNIEEAQKRLEAEKVEAEKKAQALKAAEALKAKFEAVPEIKEADKVKAVKQIYVVDMEENLQSAMILYATLSANQDLILPKLRVKKWFDLKPNQIATVLGKLKSENNSLEFDGITFKIDYKL